MAMLLANSAKYKYPDNPDEIKLYYGKDKLGNYVRADIGSFTSVNIKNSMYKLKMIRENDIPIFFKPNYGIVDNRLIIRYDITGLVNIISLASKSKFSYGRVIQILKEIVSASEGVGEYLLSKNEICLDPGCIFYNLLTKSIKLFYLPEFNKSFELQIKRLLEFFILNLASDDENGLVRLHKFQAGYNDNRFCSHDLMGL